MLIKYDNSLLDVKPNEMNQDLYAPLTEELMKIADNLDEVKELWNELEVNLYQINSKEDIALLPDTVIERLNSGSIEYTQKITTSWSLSLILFSDYGDGCYLLYPSTLTAYLASLNVQPQ